MSIKGFLIFMLSKIICIIWNSRNFFKLYKWTFFFGVQTSYDNFRTVNRLFNNDKIIR